MKELIKGILDVLALLICLPLYLAFKLGQWTRGGDRFFWGVSQLLSMVPGLSGNYIRKGFYRMAMTRCDRGATILFGTIFAQADTEIGAGVYIGPFCNIGSSVIEDHCTLGSNVHILSGSRQHDFASVDIPIQQQAGTFEKIRIGEDTWIGNSSVVMASVGKKCVIGAGSVVVGVVEDYSIMAGNPARLIRKRI